MNVFQTLQIKERKNPFQLVKHYDEVTPKNITYPLLGQVKKDGIFAAVLTQGMTATIFGRTGKRLKNVELQQQDFFQLSFESKKDLGIPQGFFIAELCSNECSLEVLSGIVNPNRIKPLSPEQEKIKENMFLCFHDFITILEFTLGKCPMGYLEREARMAKYLLKEQVIKSYVLENETQKDEFAQICIDKGEEGAVFKHPLADWEAGHKGWRVMKKVRGVSFDLECIGYEEGKGKYAGKVANLLFRFKDDVTIKAMLGKGWTHDDAQCMFAAMSGGKLNYISDKIMGSPIGKVFEVKGLQLSSTGTKIRLPKAGEIRHDKLTPDY